MNPSEFANIAATERTFWWFRGMERMLWAVLDERSAAFESGRVLEAGCGTGYQSARFRERFPAARSTSLDLSADGLRYARGLGLRDLAQSDIRALPFASGSFDLLLSLDVIAHLEPGQERGVFAEFARVLRPGGLLVVRASAFDWLRSKHSEFVWERQRYSKSKLLPLLAPSGLELARATYANSLLLPVALAKFRLWEPLFERTATSGLEAVAPWLNAVLERVLRVEAAWLRWGGGFPLGQSLWLVARKREAGR